MNAQLPPTSLNIKCDCVVVFERMAQRKIHYLIFSQEKRRDEQGFLRAGRAALRAGRAALRAGRVTPRSSPASPALTRLKIT